MSKMGYIRRTDLPRMSNTDYNGWTNRETWAVALHIGSTEEIYRPYRNIAIELAKQARVSHPDKWEDETRYACYLVFEKMIEEQFSLGTYLKEDIKPTNGNPIAMQKFLIPKHNVLAMEDIGSLWRVNFTEIGNMMAEMGIEVVKDSEEE